MDKLSMTESRPVTAVFFRIKPLACLSTFQQRTLVQHIKRIALCWALPARILHYLLIKALPFLFGTAATKIPAAVSHGRAHNPIWHHKQIGCVNSAYLA